MLCQRRPRGGDGPLVLGMVRQHRQRHGLAQRLRRAEQARRLLGLAPRRGDAGEPRQRVGLKDLDAKAPDFTEDLLVQRRRLGHMAASERDLGHNEVGEGDEEPVAEGAVQRQRLVGERRGGGEVAPPVGRVAEVAERDTR